MVTPKQPAPPLPPISTVPELRAALLAGMITGDAGKALRYDVINYILGNRGWAILVKEIIWSTSDGGAPMTTNQRCKIVLDYLNKRYPPGVSNATDQRTPL